MKVSSAFCCAILFAALASQGHAAQSSSAPVLLSQTTQPTGAYYEQNASNVCNSGGNTSGTSGGASGANGTADTCKIDFAAPPTGKYLVVEGVSCNLSLLQAPLKNISLATASGTNDSRLRALEPTSVSQSEDVVPTHYYSVNDAVLYALRGAPRIVIHSIDIGTLTMACQISGHLNTNQ